MATGSIIALDLSRQCTGIAHDGPDPTRPLMSSYRAPAPLGLGEGDGIDYGRTYAGFRGRLVALIGVVKPSCVAFEAPMHVVGGHGSSRPTNQATVRVLFGLAAITEEACGSLGVLCFEVNIATIKKHFAGHGRAEKNAMMARCRQLGWAVENDNEADAAALWCYAKSIRDPKWSPNGTPLFGGAHARASA